jgi:hypothetical protein
MRGGDGNLRLAEDVFSTVIGICRRIEIAEIELLR